MSQREGLPKSVARVKAADSVTYRLTSILYPVNHLPFGF